MGKGKILEKAMLSFRWGRSLDLNYFFCNYLCVYIYIYIRHTYVFHTYTVDMNLVNGCFDFILYLHSRYEFSKWRC